MADSQNLLIFGFVFIGAIGVCGLVFAFLAYQQAQKIHATLSHNLALLENGLKHYFNGANEAARSLRSELLESLNTNSGNLQTQFTALRTENLDARAKLEESMIASTNAFAQNQSSRLNEINEAIKALLETNEKRGKDITEALTTNLDKLREENGKKLEEMRVTVDEKLQGTLEKRLGESFKMVADNLEAVHKGLGEMQTLATGVGDLKRVLTNVKSRGTWGEVQLEMLLDDMLTREQFDKNVKINPDKNVIVEFAIKLPGKFEDTPIYLPIDAKFPQEDYERLTAAHETGTPDEIDKAEAALERAIKLQAKTISDKYIVPPHTTDFAIMYLPTEGLFAEVVRKPGFVQSLQGEFRVMVTGPTTLAATLSSLQMGFRTLAIEKRSSEVWQILGAAKTEFSKYGEVWDKLKKQLETAQNTVEQAGRRTRQIERKLRDVEAVEIPNSTEDVIALAFGDEVEE